MSAGQASPGASSAASVSAQAGHSPALAATLSALAATRDETVTALRQPPATLERTYRPGGWSARQVLLHLVDCEGVMLDRLRRLAADDKPLLWAFDENRWSAVLAHPGRDLETAIALYTATRATIIEMAGHMPVAVHARAGIHAEAGKRTWIEQLAMVHQHNAHHLGQVRACIAGTPWRPQG
jgi:uncharacterized damage-inducible protein DinB